MANIESVINIQLLLVSSHIIIKIINLTHFSHYKTCLLTEKSKWKFIISSRLKLSGNRNDVLSSTNLFCEFQFGCKYRYRFWQV